MAAEHGYAAAQDFLGRMNAAGEGFDSCLPVGRLAARQGLGSAGEARDGIAEIMTAAQIAAAQRLGAVLTRQPATRIVA